MEDGIEIAFDEPPVLGAFHDGWHFIRCIAGNCDTTLVRIWDNIDPALRDIYELNPAFTDLVFFVDYDRNYDENLHNTVAVSNLPDGIVVPAGAVTGVSWHQRGVGVAADIDILAETGGIEDYFELTYFAVSAPPDTPRPGAAVLHQNVPNTFNPRTEIPFSLVEAAAVSLHIHDATGRLVRSLLVEAPRSAGHHREFWDGRDGSGRPRASGPRGGGDCGAAGGQRYWVS